MVEPSGEPQSGSIQGNAERRGEQTEGTYVPTAAAAEGLEGEERMGRRPQ